MPKKENREYSAVVERDEDGFYVASVVSLAWLPYAGQVAGRTDGSHRDAIALHLDEIGEKPTPTPTLDFIGVQRVTVPA